MKINQRNVISCGLSNKEVQDFERWGTAMDLSINQAIKRCIAYTIQNLKPDQVEERRSA